MVLASKTFPANKRIQEINEKQIDFENSKQLYVKYFKEENSLSKWKNSSDFFRSPLPKLTKLPVRSSNSEERSSE
jgi:hypothetical protein